MYKIGLIGGGFQHAYSSTLWKKPKYFIWEKNSIEDITCFVDDSIISKGLDIIKNKKIAWIVESSAIIPQVINYIKLNHKQISDQYEFLITHDKSISCLEDNFYYLPPSGYWVENPECYPKTRLCSMITSDKNFCTGHSFRLESANKLKDKLDLFGRGIRTFEKKEDALADYMFSVTMENASYEGYWSEKILDAFITGTIPIYHGSPDIGNFFNLNGIIILNDNFNIKDINKDLYYSKMEYIKDNFERALKYFTIEDLIVEKFLN